MIKHNEFDGSRSDNKFSELKISNFLLIAVSAHNHKLH